MLTLRFLATVKALVRAISSLLGGGVRWQLQLSGSRDCDKGPPGWWHILLQTVGIFESCHQQTSVRCLGLGWADLLQVGRGFG